MHIPVINLLPYIGNKGCIFEVINDMMPQHDLYIEPCCGSAEVFFRKQPSKKEIINDYNGDVVTLYRTIRDTNKLAAFIGRLFLSANCEELFKANRRLLKSIPNVTEETKGAVECFKNLLPEDLNRAAAFFENQMNSFSSTGTSYAIKGVNIIPKLRLICAANLRLQNTAILHRDYKKVISDHAMPGAFIFLDPPYKGKEKCYQKSNFNKSSHSELFELMYGVHMKFNGDCKFLITYGDDPYIKSFAEKYGFYYYVIPRQHNLRQAIDPGSEFFEAIITNYDAAAVMAEKDFCRSIKLQQLTLFDLQS